MDSSEHKCSVHDVRKNHQLVSQRYPWWRYFILSLFHCLYDSHHGYFSAWWMFKKISASQTSNWMAPNSGLKRKHQEIVDECIQQQFAVAKTRRTPKDKYINKSPVWPLCSTNPPMELAFWASDINFNSHKLTQLTQQWSSTLHAIHRYIHIYIHTYIRTYIQTYIQTYHHTCIHTPMDTWYHFSSNNQSTGHPGIRRGLLRNPEGHFKKNKQKMIHLAWAHHSLTITITAILQMYA